MSRVPTPDALDADWFTRCLRDNGHPGVTVHSVRRSAIGTGQIGRCFRYEFDLSGAGAGTPSSLVAKFPSDDPKSRATGVQLRNYYREVNFYRELSQRLSLSLPRCYFADIEGEGPEFALVLEDLAPAQPGNQIEGCSTAVAAAAVVELVGLQAPTWCDETLKQYDWLHDAGAAPGAMLGLYAELLGPFLERYGALLESDERRIIEQVGASPACPLFQAVGEPFCLEHVDYRLDNMLIDASREPPRVTVVDWQSVRVGKPLNDVAYFLGAGLEPARRREAERDIVRAYHRGLLEAGVEGFDWEWCWEDYRRGSFAGFGVTVIASMLVEQTERGDRMFTAMARRHARHAIDLGAQAFLD